MSEIVIAYARPDAAAADRLIGKLEGLGFAVTRELTGAVSGARRVPLVRRNSTPPRIVLWSRHYAALRSRGAARARSALLAARLDVAPLGIRVRARAVDLRAWRGRDDHKGWKALLAALPRDAALTSGRAGRSATAATPAAKGAAARSNDAKKPRAAAAKGESGGTVPAPAARKGVLGPALIWAAGAAALAAGGALVYLQVH